jgi:choline monooxygenase
LDSPKLNRQAADLPFNKQASESYTLPSRYYLDDDIYNAELSAIFYRQWWYAGHSSQLPNPGDFLTTDIGDQSLFVTKDKQGELRAFYNVCQHRGHELVRGTGHAKAIVCPYHAWTYNQHGELIAARNSKNVPNFNKCEFSLSPVRVEVFCGMVFINLDNDATPLSEMASGLEREIRDYCPTVDSLQYVARDRYEVSCNWKVMVDNFLECYHCAPAHKDFVDLVDMKSYRSTNKGIYSSHISNAARSTSNKAYEFEVGEVDFGYAGWFLWPNLTIWAYPGEANLSVLQMNPDGSNRTIEFQDWFVPDGKITDQLKQTIDYQKDVLQPEDIGLCESVQRGLKSRGYNQGRFIVDKEQTELSEHAVHHFQSMVVDALGADLD